MTRTEAEQVPGPGAAGPGPGVGTTRLVTVGAAAVIIAVLAGLVAGGFGLIGLAVLAGVLAVVGLFVGAVYRPIWATYLYLGTLPFIAGIDRSTLIPLVRPNEALLALLLLGAGLGGYLRYCRGASIPLRRHPLDLPLAAFLLMATVWPLTSLLLRGQVPQPSDLAAVLPMCKLVAIYLLVRLTVRTEPQLVRCIRLIVWPGAAIAVIAILQTLAFPPVVAMLEAFWLPTLQSAAISARGATTLASPIATGDYIIFSLVLVICCGIRDVLNRRERLGLGLVLAVGVLASGQFSTWISAAVAAALILWRFPSLRSRVWRFVPMVPIILAVGAPAVLTRMESFSEGAVPVSWLGRWDNLSTYYLPRFEPLNILLGVSPNPVLQAAETWRDVVYLEAGYLQFLWVGGIGLLAAFLWLSVAVLRSSAQLRDEPGALGATASALWVVWWFLLILTVLDPHLTMRGIGDVLFALMAIVTGGLSVHRPSWETVSGPLGDSGASRN